MKDIKVGVMGFGKTGKAVSSVLLESNQVSLQWVIRRSSSPEYSTVAEFFGVETEDPAQIYAKDERSAAELFEQFPVDVVVDFSSEEGIHYYGNEAAKRGISIVSAVSQYSQDVKDKLQELSRKTAVLYSPNITLGINFLILSSKILKSIAPYADIEVLEEHFKTKPETSGTARVIARELDVEEQGIKSVRAGGIIGTHEVLFGFPYQTIRIKHESLSREAFGNGILFAIDNMRGKSSGLYTMEDLLRPHFKLKANETPAIRPAKKPWWKRWI